MTSTWHWPFRRLQLVSKKTIFALQPQPQIHSEKDGLKLLYNGQSPIADVVAIHGLNGHRERSWTAQNGMNWLKTLLPADIPAVRVVSWGYSAPGEEPELEGPPLQRTSEKLVSDLWELRESTETHNRPIIFISHSLGGSLVKSAILYSESLQCLSSPLREISASAHGIIFMDSPELGPSTAGLQALLASVQTPDQMKSGTYKEAQWLLDVLHRFFSISERFDIIYAVAKRNEDNPSSLTGKDSQFTTQARSNRLTIHGDHGNMNKFSAPQDEGYLMIKWHLARMIKETKEN